MTDKSLHELLHFAGQHQIFAFGICALTLVAAINLGSYGKRKLKLSEIHKRPHELLTYAGAGGGIWQFISLFMEGTCK